METEQKKRCFIVTPIGGESDPIRRQIEGIIDAAIRPALGNKYELVVAHKIYEPGSITKQVISEIYNAELVIANLTDRNPNVMYELAFRHSLGTPVIMIAELGTNLPTDIIMERTIFYQNDAQGTLELQKALEKAESEIDFSKVGSPIYDVLHSIDRDKSIIQLSQNDTQTGEEVLPYILGKLNKLEDMLLANRPPNNNHSVGFQKWNFEFVFFNISDEDKAKVSSGELLKVVMTISQIFVYHLYTYLSERKFHVIFSASSNISFGELASMFDKAFFDAGFKDIKCIGALEV